MGSNLLREPVHGVDRLILWRADVDVQNQLVNSGFSITAKSIDHLGTRTNDNVLRQIVYALLSLQWCNGAVGNNPGSCEDIVESAKIIISQGHFVLCVLFVSGCKDNSEQGQPKMLTGLAQFIAATAG